MMLIITTAEWRRVLLAAALLVLISSVPYAIGWLRSDAGQVYSGATLDLMDYNSYLAKMQQGAAGSWRFHITYTSEEHAGAYTYTFYLLLGQIARWSDLSLALVFQLARVAGSMAMMAAVYVLLAALLPARPLRWIAWLLACAGSGLGWLQLLVAPAAAGGISPIDFWLIDGFLFFSTLTFPHFSAAVALLALAFTGLLDLLARTTPAALAGTALCAFGLTVIHPFGSALFLLVGGLYAGVRLLLGQTTWRRAAGALAAPALAALPVLAYDAWLFSTQPIFRAWAEQNRTLSPPPAYYLASYGLLLVLAGAGAARVLRRAAPLRASARETQSTDARRCTQSGDCGDEDLVAAAGTRIGSSGARRQLLQAGMMAEHGISRHGRTALLAVVWLVAIIPLLYAPTNLQRRFLEGVMLPLCALAAAGAVSLLRRVRARSWRRRLLLIVMALTWPSNLALVAGTSGAALSGSATVYYPAAVVAAVDALTAGAGPDDVILSSLETGNLIPARSGRRVYLGHWIETAQHERKVQQVSDFFDAATGDESRQAFLRQERITLVFHGPAERALGGFEPARAAYLAPIFSADGVGVYRVR